MGRQTLLFALWRREFAGYTRERFGRDLVAGLTVAAVALPLALACEVAGGAIVAGLVIGALSGSPYQISGPTGAMSAILIVITAPHGLRGLWLAGLLSGLIVLALGLFRLGRIINSIPAPIITGFTSGIALVIAIGQLDNASVSRLPRTIPPRRNSSAISPRRCRRSTAMRSLVPSARARRCSSCHVSAGRRGSPPP